MSEKEQTTAIAEPIDWAKEFAASAAAQAAAEKPDNKFISFKSGVLSYNDTPAPGNAIKCVIIGACFENDYYPGKYDPKKVKSPDCWAVGFDEESLIPGATDRGQEDLTDQQYGQCMGCWANEWESADEGKGKACKNTRRLAVVFPPDVGLSSDILYAKLAVTSVKNWSKYVSQLAAVVKRPTWAVITEIKVVPDMKSQFQVLFSFVGLLEGVELEGAHKLYNSLIGEKRMLFGYPVNAEEPEEAPAPKAAGKKQKF